MTDAMLAELKTVMRIKSSAFDIELNDLYEAALADLGLSGVSSEKTADSTDPLVKRAVFTYIKANFGWSNPDADRLQKAYDLLKMHLSLSVDYINYAITFSITDSTTSEPIRLAKVKFNGETKTTDASGEVVFYVRAGSNYPYAVIATGYESDNDEDNLLDVSQSQTVEIALAEV